MESRKLRSASKSQSSSDFLKDNANKGYNMMAYGDWSECKDAFTKIVTSEGDTRKRCNVNKK